MDNESNGGNDRCGKRRDLQGTHNQPPSASQPLSARGPRGRPVRWVTARPPDMPLHTSGIPPILLNFKRKFLLLGLV